MKIKHIVGITIFVFWVVITALATTGLVLYQKGQPQGGLGLGNTTTSGSNITLFTPAEVAKHNSAEDCWMIVSGKVYNVTSLISTHSGGGSVIINACGRDATNDFVTKNGAGSHRRSDMSMLGNYYIGDISSNISSQINGTNKQSTKTNTSTTNTNSLQKNQTQIFSLTLTEVAKHNLETNCWMIISRKVYNLTSFFGSHPGGDRTLASSCGTDATVAFDTKGGGGSHSQSAINMLPPFYIGNVGTTANVQILSNTTQPSVPPRGGENDD